MRGVAKNVGGTGNLYVWVCVCVCVYVYVYVYHTDKGWGKKH